MAQVETERVGGIEKSAAWLLSIYLKCLSVPISTRIEAGVGHHDASMSHSCASHDARKHRLKRRTISGLDGASDWINRRHQRAQKSEQKHCCQGSREDFTRTLQLGAAATLALFRCWVEAEAD